MNTIKIKVTPTHTRGYEAPYLIEKVEKNSKFPETEALEKAKARSRLSDYPLWIFIPRCL
jgi:hypothetical protein